MRRFVVIASVALLQATASASSLRRLEFQAIMSRPAPNCVIENGFDFVGNDISNSPGAVDTCCNQCSIVSGCTAWSWTNYNGGTCWFKSAVGKIQLNPNVKSARSFYGYAPYCQLEQDADLVGNDIANKPSASADGCCAICQSTLGCRAYSWSNHNGGTCWLKSDAGQKIYKAGVKSSTAYPVAYAFAICPAPTSGVDYVGNDVANVYSATPEGCCDICKSFPTCRAYSWTNNNGGTCWLKSAKTGIVAKAGVSSAQIYENLVPSCSAEENDVDYTGNDIANAAAADSTSCCSMCGANSACKAWTWSNYNGGTCWLKSAKGATTSKAGVKSATLV